MRAEIDGQLAEKTVRAAQELNVEWDTFSTAVKVPRSVLSLQENEFKREGIRGKVSIKTFLNRKLKALISEKTGKRAVHNGDITFEIDLKNKTVSTKINPLYLLCKYNKHSRNLSQTRWDKYESVEGFIVEAAKKVFGAKDAYLHGAGREDVDVRMLGEGRLCVVEIEEPVSRNGKERAFENEVDKVSEGAVKLRVFRRVGGDMVSVVKEGKFIKEYEAVVEFEKPVGRDCIAAIERISAVEQRTPERVKHRRADKVRRRRVWVKCTENNGRRAVFRIRSEAGTYIKELVSGDNGRTTPSFAEVAGCAAKCTSLDVINVYEYITDWW